MSKPHVVVIGCGFGGLEAVRALVRAGGVEVTLIDRTNHHLFQPLLYQVATAGLSAPAVSAPVRHILRRQIATGRLTVLRAEVVDIDAAQRQVALDDGQRIAWDHLIVAAGATHSYFGHDDWAAYAPGLKTLADAFAIRARVLEAFERAETTDDPAERDACLSFVIIGGGPTGVELAGALAEIARHTLPQEFRHIDSRQARIVLLEGSPRVLGAFEPAMSERAARQLEDLGVTVRTGCQVVGIDSQGVALRGPGPAPSNSTSETAHTAEPERLPARTVLWAAGVAASPLGRVLQRSTGAALDRAGRVVVMPDLSLAGHPDIQVIGDLAAATTPGPGGEGRPQPVPGVSPAAKQMGRHAAANLKHRLRGQPAQPFRYADYGTLATIGRMAAVVQLALPGGRRLRLWGYAAWLFWLFAHVYFLIGFRNRLVVLIDWAWSYWTFDRQARVVAQPNVSAHAPAPESPPRAPPKAAA